MMHTTESATEAYRAVSKGTAAFAVLTLDDPQNEAGGIVARHVEYQAHSKDTFAAMVEQLPETQGAIDVANHTWTIVMSHRVILL